MSPEEEQIELFDTNRVDTKQILEHLDAIDIDELKHNWPGVLADILDVITSRLLRDKMPEEQSGKLAQHVVVELANYFGGRMIYLPRDDKLRKALRDHEIYCRFKGNNHDRLAQEYRLTVVQIYTIIREQRQAHRLRNQHDLFVDA